MDRKVYYLMWANLVDMAYASILSNIARSKGRQRAKEEFKHTLWRLGEEHWLTLSKMFRKLK